jgi:hypothetical protein
MKKLLLSICVVFVSLNADGMELATITQFIEQKVTQRIIPPIQQEFDHVHDTISDQGRQIEENTDENSRKFTEFERAIRSQDIAIHELKNMLIKEAVGYAFAFGEIKAELMPHHINETSNDIIQKPTIHERHKAVFTIYNQLKLLKKVLHQNELKVVEDYVNDTSIKEKVVIQAPVKPSPMPQLPTNNKLRSEVQWKSGRARINYIMKSWLREMGITDFASGSFKAGGCIYELIFAFFNQSVADFCDHRRMYGVQKHNRLIFQSVLRKTLVFFQEFCLFYRIGFAWRRLWFFVGKSVFLQPAGHTLDAVGYSILFPYIFANFRYFRVDVLLEMLVKLCCLTRRELALRASGLDFELLAFLILIYMLAYGFLIQQQYLRYFSETPAIIRHKHCLYTIRCTPIFLFSVPLPQLFLLFWS